MHNKPLLGKWLEYFIKSAASKIFSRLLVNDWPLNSLVICFFVFYLLAYVFFNTSRECVMRNDITMHIHDYAERKLWTSENTKISLAYELVFRVVAAY